MPIGQREHFPFAQGIPFGLFSVRRLLSLNRFCFCIKVIYAAHWEYAQLSDQALEMVFPIFLHSLVFPFPHFTFSLCLVAFCSVCA